MKTSYECNGQRKMVNLPQLLNEMTSMNHASSTATSIPSLQARCSLDWRISNGVESPQEQEDCTENRSSLVGVYALENRHKDVLFIEHSNLATAETAKNTICPRSRRH
mmetsp:Transcript_75901/g.146698  ORF Transcript_75901/g.146698 Transcript_75901/m.146698 type:complete len:108 (+) Transcript_75901:81-404(+)